MATVRAIGTDALMEIGVLDPAATMPPYLGALVLARAQSMIDSWRANRLALASQLRTQFTLTSGTSSVTIGIGGTIGTLSRPAEINTINYIIPGSNPSVEVPIGIMDEDAYAALSIKSLPSALPIQSFYQQDFSGTLGTLFIWPKVTQNVDLVIYTPQGVDVPATLDTDLLGPDGYRDAFMYQLAQRLLTPCGVNASDVPMLEQMAARAWMTMTRPNIQPGVLSIDAALVPGSGSGYNILSDVMQTSR